MKRLRLLGWLASAIVVAAALFAAWIWGTAIVAAYLGAKGLVR